MKKEKLILSLVFIILLGLFSFLFSVNNRYILSEDLPNLIANAKALDDFSSPAKSPFFENGEPDFHATYTTAIISLLGKWDITFISIKDKFYFLNSESLELLLNYIFFGIFSIILFILSAYIFAAKYFNNFKKAILFLIILIFIVEVPLVRWSGIFSLHGISFGAFYSQLFSISFLFLTFYLILNYNRDHTFSNLLLIPFFLFISFISHPLTGLISFSLTIFYFSLQHFKSRNNQYCAVLILIFLSFFLSNFWIYVSFFKVINSIMPYPLVLIIFIFIILLNYLFWNFKGYFQKIGFKLIDSQKIVKMGIFLTFIIYVYSIFYFKQYIYKDMVYYWLISFFPFIYAGIFLSYNYWVDYLNDIRDNFSLLLIIWFWASLMLFIIGLIGFPVKVFWRFLFLIKIPSSIFIADSVYSFLKNKANLFYIGLAIMIIVLSTMNMFSVILSSDTAKYFREVPPEFKLSGMITSENGIILSDQYTSYFISSLTNNYVLAIPSDRISDYEQERNSKFINIIQFLFSNNATCTDFQKYNISQIILNKFIRLDGERVAKAIDYSEMKYNLVKNCNFKLNKEDANFIIIGKNETLN